MAAEESKVKLKKPVSLAWRPQKRGANRVAHFLRSVFQRASPSSVRRRLAASLVLEFTGTSRAVADRTGAAIVVCASASLIFDRLQHLLRKRQIESSRRPKRFSQTVPCLETPPSAVARNCSNPNTVVARAQGSLESSRT